MKRIFLFNILIFFYFTANSQFIVSISSNYNTDTVNICEGDEITFYGFGIYDGDTLDNLNFKWDFDDNYFESDVDLDTITREFPVPKAYRIMLTVWNDTLWGYDILPVRIGLDPWFTETKADIPEDQTGICNGESIDLIGVADEHKWKEERTFVRTEIFPFYIDSLHPYSSYITLRSFNIGTTFTEATSIDSIGIKLEHSNTSNLLIKLTCPTGQTVVLKDTGGVEKALGEPILGNDFSEGVGYWYYFTNFPTNSTMNTFSGPDTLPSGTYQPDSLFTKLVGCPLNGDWTISVEDLVDDEDDGYFFAWALYFDEDIETDTLIYSNIYNLEASVWSVTDDNDEVNFTENGIAAATPVDYGAHTYAFLIKDNYGCYHDTTANITVEKALFNADKESMVIGDSVLVKDSTSWAVEWEWDFGDESDIITESEDYKKYLDSGYYAIIMKAVSSSGCVDYDTAEIRITPKPLSITQYNIFTPNGDGVNDVFTFFNTDDEKITAANIAEVHGGIYNRYGELVCRWNTPEKILYGWDGTKNNDGIRPLPSGFYYYNILMKGKDGLKYQDGIKTEDKIFSGYIYLYRSRE